MAREVNVRMAFTERFDHVAVAVEDAEKAASLFRDVWAVNRWAAWIYRLKAFASLDIGTRTG